MEITTIVKSGKAAKPCHTYTCKVTIRHAGMVFEQDVVQTFNESRCVASVAALAAKKVVQTLRSFLNQYEIGDMQATNGTWTIR